MACVAPNVRDHGWFLNDGQLTGRKLIGPVRMETACGYGDGRSAAMANITARGSAYGPSGMRCDAAPMLARAALRQSRLWAGPSAW